MGEQLESGKKKLELHIGPVRTRVFAGSVAGTPREAQSSGRPPQGIFPPSAREKPFRISRVLGREYFTREGVKTMKYEKPEVHVMTGAVKAIEGGKAGLAIDGVESNTPSAYEADE